MWRLCIEEVRPLRQPGVVEALGTRNLAACTPTAKLPLSIDVSER